MLSRLTWLRGHHLKGHFTSLPSTFSMKKSLLDQIVLTDKEKAISTLLVDYCQEYNKNLKKPLILRITGGWVRDKLLGKESNDLDIAVNEILGEDFASGLQEYIKASRPDIKLGSSHVIKKNPQKSKHLETCTTRLFDLDIDFVNLRSEKYSDESRVPIIEFGTAEEDALRRDATLNALFYNLNDSKIEDFTKRGKRDLEDGVLRTPLQPLQTFFDDPLRVLRLIRFASRFNFTIDQSTLEAMRNDQIEEKLKYKISRERVGVEMVKTLSSENPQYGLKLISYVKLSSSMFGLGNLDEVITKINDREWVERWNLQNSSLDGHVYAASHFYESFTNNLIRSELHFALKWRNFLVSTQTKCIFWYCAVLVHFKDLVAKVNVKKAQTQHIPEVILKEGLRVGKHEFEPVSVFLQEYEKTSKLAQQVQSGDIPRSVLGLHLRKFGPHLELNLFVCCFLDSFFQSLSLNPSHLCAGESLQPVPNSEPDPQWTCIIQQELQKYSTFLDLIERLNLIDVSQIKPLVDGKVLSKSLNLKPGPWMGKINQDILVWQLDHQNGTKEECLEYAKLIVSKYL